MALYKKYRPNELKDLIGDYSAVFNVLSESTGNRVFLFTGPSGSGKTTLARIVGQHVQANTTDILEVNCADDTSIDGIRNILEMITYSPIGKAWVIILDEAHKLSTSAQEILNKPLEDGRQDVYWILCTDQPDKLKETVQSRAMVVKFTPHRVDDLFVLLRNVNNQEGFKVNPKVLTYIAEKAMGNARKAISMLEYVGKLSEPEREKYMVSDVEDDAEMIELCRAVYNKQWVTIVQKVNVLKDKYDVETMRRAILGYVMAILSKQQAPQRFQVMLANYLLDIIPNNEYNRLLVQIGKALT